jgi:hypothetical protein
MCRRSEGPGHRHAHVTTVVNMSQVSGLPQPFQRNSVARAIGVEPP